MFELIEALQNKWKFEATFEVTSNQQTICMQNLPEDLQIEPSPKET